MASFLTRRSFLKTGLIGALALAAAGGIYRGVHRPASPEGFIFGEDAKAMLAAIIPVLLKDAVAPTAIESAIDRVQQAVAGLPLIVQKEVQDLFALLALAPARRLLTGVRDDWPQAQPDEVADFLQRWRLHRVAMLQTAYHALHDLITGSWYADESTWPSIGYPGPMKELS